jgi:hypothetical protein
VIKSPLLSSKWWIEPHDNTPRAKEQAEFIYDNLFRLENRSWNEFLKEVLTYLEFGFSVFEKIYKIYDKKIYIDDLAFRKQSSIQNWQINQGNGKIRGVTQLIQTDEHEGSNIVEIPINKCIVFTNDKEGDNLTGESMLRPVYRNFKYKNMLYDISAKSIERYGIGVPLVTLPETVGESELLTAEEMAQNITSNQSSFIIKPNKEWEIEILTPNGSPLGDEVIKLIQEHNQSIPEVVLAGFLNLSKGGSGSYALSKDLTNFFTLILEEKANYISDQINKYVIKDLIIYNWGEQDYYPTVRHTPLGDTDIDIFSKSISKLSESGLVVVNDKTQKYTHETLGLPELTDDDITEWKNEIKEKDKIQKKEGLEEIEEELNRMQNNILNL